MPLAVFGFPNTSAKIVLFFKNRVICYVFLSVLYNLADDFKFSKDKNKNGSCNENSKCANVFPIVQQPYFCQKGMYLVGEKYVENIDV